MATRHQGLSLVTAISMLIGTLVVIQLWLLAAALDALLAGATGVLIPAAVASFLLFLLNAGLLWHVRNFDERERRMHDYG
jgi:hypothetical protein